MAAGAQPAPRARGGQLSLFRWIWDLLTNVKFALLLVGTALAACMLGVVIPQMPGPMQDNTAARSAWLELQRDDFGPFTNPMERLGLFEIFSSTWFVGLWVVIIVSVTVCTVSRFRPTARSIHRPPRVVPDRYFETAHHRATVPGAETSTVESVLRARRYSVSRAHEEPGATYLFADRYPWSAYGTFVSHLALLILLVGGVLTVVAGFGRTLALAETTSAAPVFSEPGPNQLFVRMVDTVEGIDDDGNVIDYRSHLEVRRGDETITCTTTVNDPCNAFGYRFHQAAFFDDVARVRIEDPDGRVLYDDVVDFDDETTAVPAFRIRDAEGNVLFAQELPQMGTDPGASASRGDDIATGRLVLQDSAGAVTQLDFGWRVEGNELVAVIGGPDATPQQIAEGETHQVGGLSVTRLASKRIPAREISDFPGAFEGRAVVQMPSDAAGEPYLFITGIDEAAAAIAPGGTYEAASGFRFTFAGQVEAAGIDIRRDPGDTFIWVAVGLALVGLGITFYVPRRRVWVKVTPERTLMAGVAEKTARLERELKAIGEEIAAKQPPAAP